MKLTYDDKVQIYELRKQGYSLEKLSNKIYWTLTKDKYIVKKAKNSNWDWKYKNYQALII